MRSKLYEKIAKELDVSSELVKAIDDHVFFSISEHMKDPKKWKFLLNNFITFEPKYNSIKKFIEKYEGQENLAKGMQEKLEHYRKLLEIGDYYRTIQKQNGEKRKKQT